jgi:hypothetical protein
MKQQCYGRPNFFYDKGPHLLLWADSRSVRGEITACGVLWPNVYSAYIIYKRGRGPHDTTWRAAG